MGASQTKQSPVPSQVYSSPPPSQNQGYTRYKSSKPDLPKLPCNYVKDWLLTLEDTRQIPESEMWSFIKSFPYTINYKELTPSDVIDCINRMNSGEYGYLDSRILTPIKIITAHEFICKYVKEWVKTLPDPQRITNDEVETFFNKFNTEINVNRKYYTEQLYSVAYDLKPCIDEINKSLPADQPPVGFVFDIPKLTSSYKVKPVQEKEKYYSNPLVVLQSLNELDNAYGIDLLPYIDETKQKQINPYNNDAKKTAEEQASNIRQQLAPIYAKILILFLKTYKKSLRIDLTSLCSEQLRVLEEIYFIKIDNQFSRLYNYSNKYEKPNSKYRHMFLNESDIEVFSNEYPDTSYDSPTVKSQIIESIRKYTSKTVKQINQIKKEFESCKNQYYIIPYATLRLYTPGHQNLIILDKVNKRVIYIEPQYYGSIEKRGQDMTDEEQDRVNRILQELGLTDYTKVLPVIEYPQSIANDKNCMFWTFLITVTFLLNPQATNPDQIAAAIIKKYPDRDSLVKYIEGFRFVLGKFTEVPASYMQRGSKRRKTYRKKKSKKSKTSKRKH